MKDKSLAFKLFLATALLLFISVAVLTLVVGVFLDSTADKVRQQSTAQVTAELKNSLQAQAGEAGLSIAAFINEAYRTPLSLAGVLENSINSKRLFSRNQVEQLDQAMLLSTPAISAIYSQFESNGYDGKDADYQNGFSHSVKGAGNLEIYFTRNRDGSIEQQPVDDPAEKHDASLDSNGQRKAEWYLCAMDTKKPCLMEPYLYEIAPGNTELMTSLTVPVVADGRFRGVIGVDLNLPVFQRRIEALAQSLYKGNSSVLLLSHKGFLVAASQYPRQLAKPLSSVMPNLADKLLAMKANDSFSTDDHFFIAYPVHIDAPNVNWTLIISVPKAAALASVDAMNSSIKSRFDTLVFSQLMTGLVVVLLALLLMALLIRTITKPLKDLNSRISNLNSNDGDLTQEVAVDRHRELMTLASGFNHFLGKLRAMISHQKSISHQVGQQAQESASIATETRALVARQHSEIDSVVTAMNEMSAAASEVAQFAAQAAGEAKEANSAIQSSRGTLETAVSDVQQLADRMSTAATAVNQVAARSGDIHSILDVIRSIAEQTNLLALNAAIEAARAGEHGRGFAVVADEVRALAAKTRSSTDDISEVISNLNNEVSTTVAVIDQGVDTATATVEVTQSAYQDLQGVVELINTINDHVTQMATAAEEQSSVSDEINRNITGIGSAASELATLAGKAETAGTTLHQLVKELDSELAKLQT